MPVRLKIPLNYQISHSLSAKRFLSPNFWDFNFRREFLYPSWPHPHPWPKVSSWWVCVVAVWTPQPSQTGWVGWWTTPVTATFPPRQCWSTTHRTWSSSPRRTSARERRSPTTTATAAKSPCASTPGLPHSHRHARKTTDLIFFYF